MANAYTYTDSKTRDNRINDLLDIGNFQAMTKFGSASMGSASGTIYYKFASLVGEPAITEIQKTMFRDATQLWSNVANVTFQPNEVKVTSWFGGTRTITVAPNITIGNVKSHDLNWAGERWLNKTAQTP